jgi:hypothetical protein
MPDLPVFLAGPIGVLLVIVGVGLLWARLARRE